MSNSKYSAAFRVIRRLVLTFYGRYELVGIENLPKEPAIIVGNHSQMHGPLACELFFPGERRIWCAGQMMNADEVQEYAYKDFWPYKPKYIQWFYKLLSYAIVPLSVCIFNNAHTIGVYHDTRLIGTFRNTISAMENGENIIIFPEHDLKYNHILYDFQTKFVDTARFYYKKTKKEVSFVPLYIAPKLKKMYLGKAIKFNHDVPIEEERKRICQYLMEQITDIACALPEHTVVPYLNISPKMYNKNITGGSRI